jgi:ribose 5-phosphate isomerase B
MKIILGTDHAGFELKQQIAQWLQEGGHDIVDMGAHEYVPGDDYPDFIRPVAAEVAIHSMVSEDPSIMGIIFGGSGTGEAIVANKMSGVRSAVYYGGPIDIVTLSREHNNANILSIGARFVDFETAKAAVTQFMQTKFQGGRHIQRLEKID